MNPSLILLLLLGSIPLAAQQSYSWKTDTLFAVPGGSAKGQSPPEAKMHLEIGADSIVLIAEVKDDNIVTRGKHPDGIAIWFASTSCQFTDYVSAQYKGKTYLFRNSDEPGDFADVKRMLQQGDYPQGKLVDPFTGAESEMLVPRPDLLQRDFNFAGMVQFFCPAGDSPATLMHREHYRSFENQTGYQFGKPEQNIQKSYTEIRGGYHIRLSMPLVCLGFLPVSGTNQLRVAIEVLTAKELDAPQERYSSVKNHYFARPWYFTHIELPFTMKPSYDPDLQFLIGKCGMHQELVYTSKGWKPYGLSKGAALYAREHVSESGIMQYLYYPVALNVTKSASREAGEWQRLDIVYDDMTIFKQHEVYFYVLGQIISGKMPGYAAVRKDAFVNKVFFTSADTALVSIYDYEPNDPLGFGEFGLSADEYYSIQQVTSGSNTTVFSSGERIQAAGTINLGEDEGIVREQVQKTEYKWIKAGDLFEVKISFRHSKKPEIIEFTRQASAQFKRIN